MLLVDMDQDRERDDSRLRPFQFGRPAEDDPEGEDPMLVAARWRLSRADEDEDSTGED